MNCDSQEVPGGSQQLALRGRDRPQVRSVQVVGARPLSRPAAPRQQAEGARLPRRPTRLFPALVPPNLAPRRPPSPASAGAESSEQRPRLHVRPRPSSQSRPLEARTSSGCFGDGVRPLARTQSRTKTPLAPGARGLGVANLELGFNDLIFNPIRGEEWMYARPRVSPAPYTEPGPRTQCGVEAPGWWVW